MSRQRFASRISPPGQTPQTLDRTLPAMAPFVPPVPDMDLIRLISPITDRPFRRSCELLDSPSSPRHEVQELSLLLQTTPAEQQPSSRHVGTPRQSRDTRTRPWLVPCARPVLNSGVSPI